MQRLRPPSTAAIACSAVRTILFSGCCALASSRRSECGAEHPGLGFLGAEVIAHDPRPHTARRAELGYFLQKIAVCVEEEGQPGCETCPHRDRRRIAACTLGHAVRQREGDLLHRWCTLLPHVVTRDGNRVPLRHVLVRVGEDIVMSASPEWGIDVGAARMYSFNTSFCIVPESLRTSCPVRRAVTM